MTRIVKVLLLLLAGFTMSAGAMSERTVTIAGCLSLDVPPSMEVIQRSPVEDFVVVQFWSDGQLIMGAYVGNAPEFPGNDQLPEASDRIIGEFTAKEISSETESSRSSEVLIDLGGTRGWPRFFHLKIEHVSRSQFLQAEAIINSIRWIECRTTRVLPDGVPAPGRLVVDEHQEAVVEEVIALLASTPCWPTLGAADDEQRTQISETYAKVATYEDAVIRAAMIEYVKCCSGCSECSPSHDFSVFNLRVLNRFVFNVPERISKERLRELPFFIGRGGPRVGDDIDLLWPLTVAESGNVHLTAQFYWSGGPMPDALGEFDAFRRVFGRRFPVDRDGR